MKKILLVVGLAIAVAAWVALRPSPAYEMDPLRRAVVETQIPLSKAALSMGLPPVALSSPYAHGTRADPANGEPVLCKKTRGEEAALAKLIVEQDLIAPGSAEYVRFEASQFGESGCEFHINGEVDAQNSFGALLRHTFRMTLVLDESQQEWELTSYSLNRR